MQNWEYRVGSDLSESELNRLGQEGWELVGVTMDEIFHTRFYFKRPAQ